MTKLVRCQGCGSQIGELRLFEGSEWLVVNGVVVNYMKGACSVCGSEFFWSISERQLANLIKGVLDKRRK